ncbi:unnamed protein product [Adineta ricciae]|uniref:Uncharacterized protein n=1 Tax=Adineta ricciae TaxID=249248 RepID=A0A815WSI3_ADIRI|nr:unnamed protein product [Adineta ricciae]CAF1635530.1 unnamed protein product [Adineta ricciae]
MLYPTGLLLVLITLAFAENNVLFRRSTFEENVHETENIAMISCLHNCKFEFSFNDSVTVPSSCRSYLRSTKCTMILEMDYMENSGSVTFDLDDTTDIDFNSSIAVNAKFSFEPTITRKSVWSYECATGNECNAKYFKKYISHYMNLTKELETLQFHLSDVLYANNKSKTVEQCFNKQTTLESCNDGTCMLSWNDSQNSTTTYTCQSTKNPVHINYQVVKTDPIITAPSVSNSIQYVCNIDKCNSYEGSLAVRLAVAVHWGGVLDTNSASIRLFNVSLLLLTLIKFFI